MRAITWAAACVLSASCLHEPLDASARTYKNDEFGFSISGLNDAPTCPILSGGHDHGIVLNFVNAAFNCSQPAPRSISVDGEYNVIPLLSRLELLHSACKAFNGTIADLSLPLRTPDKVFSALQCNEGNGIVHILVATQVGRESSGDGSPDVAEVNILINLQSDQPHLYHDITLLNDMIANLTLLKPLGP